MIEILEPYLPVIVLFAGIGGACTSVITGFMKRKEGESFNKGQLFSSLLIASVAVMTLGNYTAQPIIQTIGEVGLLQVIVQNFIMGFGWDKLVSFLDHARKKSKE